METHPVPQNVTSFQFRLIGDMTIKQFGYLSGGAILAYIAYKLPLPSFFTWPLATLFALTGIGFAFIPIEERPMDIWVFSFFKSIYNPTQYIWKRGSSPPTPTQISQVPPAKLAPVGFHLPLPKVHLALDALESLSRVFVSIFGYKSHPNLTGPSLPPCDATFTPQSSVTIPPVTGKRPEPPKLPTLEADSKTQKQLKDNQGKIAQLEKELANLQQKLETKTTTETRILELQKQLTQVLAEKERMEDELQKFRQQPVATPASLTQKTTVATPSATPTVRVLTPGVAVRAGMPRLTSVPNVVTGILKDTQGNLLPGVLITVRDHEGVPMRALKTNKLGQFAASTPLPNGTYLVEVEDPRGRFIFDRAQVTLGGAVAPPLEVVAKSQKELIREKLAQEIFGNQPM